MTDPPPFAIDDALPAGLTALEASAGTGKTYALSSLAARYVAERGVPAAGLCVVSFTEAATADLRSRVRGRLAEVHDHLDRCLSIGGPVPTEDRLLAVVADTGPAGLDARRRNVVDAIAEFDAATITTIHGFCRRVLAGAGGSGGDLDITDGATDVAEAVTDLFIARFGDDPECPIVPRRLEQAVRLRLAMPDAEMWRLPADVRPPSAGQRVHHDYCDATADLVDEICATVQARRAARRHRTFDGLLAGTRSLLSGPEGAVVVAGLRQRTQVVLIDEFQDTDTIQWDIFRRAFASSDPNGTLPVPAVVLVGDPKQSIYRFRSAELSAYLAAVAAADEVATLPTNWRSDATLLRALDTLFSGFHFGDPAVAFQSVSAADHHRERAITGAGTESLTLRWVAPDADGDLAAPAAHQQIERDVVATVRELLDAAAAGTVTVPDDTDSTDGGGTDDGGADVARRRLRPSDIAILTRSNTQASTLTRMLGDAGIAAASASNESVLESEAARQWRHLLAALERPGVAGRVRAAALGWSLGITAEQLDRLDERGLDDLHDRFRGWSHELSTEGLPRLIGLVRAAGLYEHVLSHTGGERHLTDFDHIAELLLTITAGRPTTATTLLGHMAALDRGVFDPGGGSGKQDAMATDVLARRIDRDDEAVQVLTIHKAKGLEFGVVLCPYLWFDPRSSGPPHAQLDGIRRIQTPWITDAPTGGAWLAELKSANGAEIVGEDRRLLYVALTRARHRCYLWWPAITTGGKGGALGALLAHAIGSGAPPTAPTELSEVVARSDGTFAVHDVPYRAYGAPQPAADGGDRDLPALEVAAATRLLDRSWRIWSFSAIASAASAPGETAERPGAVGAQPHAEAAPMVGGTDEPAADPDGDDLDAPVALPGVLRSVVGGTAFGTMVHEVLEQVDFAAVDLDHELWTEIDRRRRGGVRVDPALLVRGLVDAIDAPLGGPLGATRLRDVSRRDRLDELQFDLPLGRLRADRIGRVLADHLTEGDPLRPWAERVAEHGFDIDVAGMLTGSIDLVVRHGGDPGTRRFVVVDYKTNQLGPTAAYDTAGLVAAMEHHHYPLQAALYLVALHRYLRWRLPGYRTEHHLGGAAYLFLRGMDPARPAADARGVCWWTPPPAAVHALDRLLAGDPR